MRRLIWISLLLLSAPFAAFADEATVLEIEVSGMVCAFCVEAFTAVFSNYRVSRTRK